ncbi:inosine/xanthosine triphosphatase, partial [[Eubacterium] cellulosolvens]
MRVVLGGTFSPLHNGHKALFNRAFELGEGELVIIGLTSDSMANAQRTRPVIPFIQRKQELEDYLMTRVQKHPGTKYEIIEITEVFNVPITQEIDADALVVSEGRKHVAEETNAHRIKHGKLPLEIVAVPYVLAQDGLPIKATRIADGEIDSQGNLLGTVTVAVGTENDVKYQAVNNVFSKLFSTLKILKVPVSSGVKAQPMEDETIAGAKNRAQAAMEQTSKAHFAVGIEAGLFEDNATGKFFDVQYCAIIDRGGRITVGHGSGFYYPDKVIDGVKAGRTIGEVMSTLTGIQDIGKKLGAIGYLTKNILTREALTEQAVLMAMVPR